MINDEFNWSLISSLFSKIYYICISKLQQAMGSFLERKWMQELGILLFSFTLLILNDWILIATWKSLFLGTVYFMLLYIHAQLNRYVLLPILYKKHRAYLYIMLTLCLLVLFTFLLNHIAQSLLYKNCFLHKDTSKLTYKYKFGVLLGSCICILSTTQFLEYYRKQKKKPIKKFY